MKFLVSVGVGAVFYQQDGRLGTSASELSDQWLGPFSHRWGKHVGQAVDDIQTRVQLGQQSRERPEVSAG